MSCVSVILACRVVTKNEVAIRAAAIRIVQAKKVSMEVEGS